MLNNRTLRLLRRSGEFDTQKAPRIPLFWALVAFLAIIMVILMCGCALADDSIDGHTLDQWANAIGKAENSKAHPYGIMVKYRNTTPRQACKNTVAHRYHDWQRGGAKTPFIQYLAGKYAPIGASNDPNNLNRNWVKNVSYWLKRG